MLTKDIKSTRWTYLWLALFGVFNLFASGKWTLAPAAWLGSVFALLFLYTHPKRIRILHFYLVLWITLAISWYGATPIWGLAHYIFMAVTASIGMLPSLIDRWLTPRLRRDGRLRFIGTFIYPVAVTALEFLSTSSNPIGNFSALGYSQYSIPVLAQLTAVTGLLGLTFLVSWFASVVIWAWDNEFSWKPIRVGVIAYSAVLVVVVGYGAIRLSTAPKPGSQETVTVISFTLTEIHMGELNELLAEDEEAYRQKTQEVHTQYLDMTESAIDDGAEIILWPELAVVGLEQDVQDVIAQGKALALQAGIYLAMPTFTLYPDSEQLSANVLYVAGPDGELVIEHTKYGGNIFEGTLKGSEEIQVIDTAYGKLAGIICWDTNYPNIVRQVGKQDAAILLSPSKEWSGINPLHAEMAVFRAIENGVALVRQTDEGLSIVVDAYGRILGTGEGLAATGNYIRAEVPTRGTRTLYPVLGDAIGLLSAIGFVILAVYVLIVGRSVRKNTKTTATDTVS